MAGVKGRSGTNKGKDKAFANALRLAVSETDPRTGFRKLRGIAEKLVECALNGESWAVQQVADRLDGKPAQEQTVTIDDKRDAADWSREELVAFLNNARDGRRGDDPAVGRGREPDSVH